MCMVFDITINEMHQAVPWNFWSCLRPADPIGVFAIKYDTSVEEEPPVFFQSNTFFAVVRIYL